MSKPDLTTYRIDWPDKMAGIEREAVCALDQQYGRRGFLVEDGRLQAIADALPDLLELAESGIGYTPDYFREKWGMDDELAEIKAKIKDALGGTDND